MNSEKLTASQVERIQKALETVPFAKLLGIELEEVAPGTATLGFDIRDDLKQNNGVVHGGAIASLVDTATAFAIISLLPPDEKATTADLTISYLRPLRNGRAQSTARVIRAGRRLIVVSAELVDDAGNLIATALTTYIKI
ncbi:MAG: PaaI family thioesterase [Pyrinomonadaceae bacterium]|nr:PaaI family thioesterase [Pyrinomonadaceae bacterium]MBA3572912.1 PaaI family thioesterase [Pyrinomonadaceae bacterium]